MQANQSLSTAFGICHPLSFSKAEELPDPALRREERSPAVPWLSAAEQDSVSVQPEPAQPELAELYEPVFSPGLAALHLLIVDRDCVVLQESCELAGKLGFTVVPAKNIEEARAVLKQRKVDLVLLDPSLSQGCDLGILAEVKALAPEASILVMTAGTTVTHAVEAMRAGAGDYLPKPFARQDLAAMLRRAADRPWPSAERQRLREKLRNGKSAGHLAGSSPEMEKLYRIVSKVTHTAHPVLIVGEGGTGKELVARTIHFNGPGAHKPFVPVDCGSLMPSLMEGELFGYVKGAFPAAVRGKQGLLTASEGGTVFLDDVTELPVDLQSKLLRALQDKVVRPLGGTQMVPLATRVLAATHRDLKSMVEQGRFRRDLYFRLNVVSLRIPPLRERKSDIAELAQYCLERQQRETGRALRFSEDCVDLMRGYSWPGNVRELEMAVERACSLSSGPLIHTEDLPAELQAMRREQRTMQGPEKMVVAELAAERRIVSLAELERETIRSTLRHLNGDKLRAAKLLGIGKTTLYRKLKEYGILEGNEQG